MREPSRYEQMPPTVYHKWKPMTGKGTFARHCRTIFILFVLGSMFASWLTFCIWLASLTGERYFAVFGVFLAMAMPLVLFLVAFGVWWIYTAVYQGCCDYIEPPNDSEVY